MAMKPGPSTDWSSLAKLTALQVMRDAPVIPVIVPKTRSRLTGISSPSS